MVTQKKKSLFPCTPLGVSLVVVLHAGVALTAEQTGIWYGFSVNLQEGLHAFFLLLLVGAYLLAVYRMQHGYTPSMQQAVFVLALSAAPYFLNFLTKSSDVYNYIAYAEISQHASPYLQGPASLGPGNPIWHGVWDQWRPYPSPYGPLWMGIVVLIGKLHAGLVTQFFIFKFFGVAMFASIAALLVRWRPRTLALLVILNPILLIELIGDAHNDGLFVVLILLALIPFGNSLVSGLSFGLSIATKHISIVLSPLFLAAYAREKKYREMLFASGSALVALVLMYALLWVGPKMFEGLLVMGRQFYVNPIFFPQKLLLGIIRTTHPDIQLHVALQFAVVIGTSIAILGIGWLTWLVWRGRLELPVAAFYAFCAVIFFALQWVQPWYLTWPLVLTPFMQPKHAYRAVFALTVGWFIMIYTVY